MKDKPTDWTPAGQAFAVFGLLTCGVGALTSGVFAVFACVVALGCLAGAVAVALTPEKSSFERYCEECDAAPNIAFDEPAITQAQEPGQSPRWQQTVDASRKGCRSR